MHQLLARIGVLEQKEVNFILQGVRQEDQIVCLVDLLVTKPEKVQRNLWRMLDITSQVSLDTTVSQEEKLTYSLTKRRNTRVQEHTKLADNLGSHSEFQKNWLEAAKLWVDTGTISVIKVREQRSREDFSRSVVVPLLERWEEVAPSLSTVGNVVRTLRSISLTQTADEVEQMYITNG